MRRELVARLSHITTLHTDYWLWREGQHQGPGIKPYYRTRSIYY